MRKIKLLLSTSFLIFLFLPLAQCSIVPSVESDVDSVPLIEQREAEPDLYIPIQVVDEDIDVVILMLLTFCFPLVASMPNPAKFKQRLAVNLAQIISGSWLLYVITDILFGGWYTPLISGYILFTLTIIFVLLSVYTLFKFIGGRHNNQLKNDVLSRAS